MATSREANLRLQAQAIIATVLGPVNVSTASWAASVATITIGAHSVKVGQTISVSNILPAGYNGNFKVTAVSATTFNYALPLNPGAYSSGGVATTQVSLGTEDIANGVNWFSTLPLPSTAIAGPAAIVLPAENSEWDGQVRHIDVLIKINLYFAQAGNALVDFTAFEDVWTAVRSALVTLSNWSTWGTPDKLRITQTDRRTDSPDGTNLVYIYMFELTFPSTAATGA